MIHYETPNISSRLADCHGIYTKGVSVSQYGRKVKNDFHFRKCFQIVD